MANPSRVIVLAEDARHQRFVYRYLKQIGYSQHDVHFEGLPAGRGCGEQWVRERYAKNVRAYRSRAARAETALIVAIDADNHEIAYRVPQLEQSLVQTAQEARSAQEKIAHLIPKRSIETWVLCLNGLEIDEVTDYKNENGIDDRIQPAAENFFGWSRRGVIPPAHCISSLRVAIPEVQRLEH